LPRAIADPSARIELLKARRAKFVKSKIKGPVQAEELAQIVGMSWRSTLKPMVDEDPNFPCLMRGSEGVAYKFDALKAIDYIIKVLAAKLKERTTRIAAMAEMAGFDPQLAEAGMSLDELRTLDALQVSMQRRKIEQRNYVPLAEFEATIADIFSTIQAELLSTAGRLDPSGRWPAAVRNAVREEMRSVLVRTHDKLGKRLNPNAATAPRRTGRARSART
jgi:hypothetical protein